MSIASEITRLINAKAAIRSAIQAKGVNVPSTAKLDQFYLYIAAIEGSGGEVISVSSPVFSISNNTITITCDTTGATIYYKESSEVNYSVYSSGITISQDGTYYAYAEKDGFSSEAVSYSATYVASPVFSFSNNTITITCATSGATIYYKESSASSYSTYSSAITISQSGTYIAYASKNGNSTSIVSYTATYVNPNPNPNPTYDNTTPLTFIISSPGNIVVTSNSMENYEYNKNNSGWNSVTSTISVVNGDIVQFRGTAKRYNTVKFKDSTCGFSVAGNILSIYRPNNFATRTDIGVANCFESLFENCTGLTDASNLILQATSLVEYCYSTMFKNCSALTTAPDLPALTVSKGAYGNLFEGCTSLTYIKCLATDISAQYAVSSWVRYVSASGTFIKNASMSGWSTGIDGIPSGWTVQDAA